MWQSLAQWAAGGGTAGLAYGVLRLAYRMHLDALAARAREADSYKEQRDYERRRADLREAQLGQVLGRASETV